MACLLVLGKRIHKAILSRMVTGFTSSKWPRRILFHRALSGQHVKELEGFMISARKRGLDTVQLAWQQKHQPSTPPSVLQKIDKPVLLLNGDEDDDIASVPALIAMFKRAEQHTVKGNHNTSASSERFAPEAVYFLSQND